MRQTLAIFLDAYRELNSRKLFWIVLAISVAVILALALPSINDRGVVVFGQTLEIPFLTTKSVSPVAFYKFLFSWFGINLWLAWGATILALISTAGMIPEMVSSGAIELVLSKPISRVRLFLTKFAAGLMFVALQAAVFGVGAILVIGLRGGSWDASPLMAVPLMVLFFSYLFSVCALVGMLTRSTLLSLLATVLVWLGTWGIATAEQFLLDQRLRHERETQRLDTQLETFRTTLSTIEAQIDELRSQGAAESEALTPDDTASQPTVQEPVPADPSPPTRRGPGGGGRRNRPSLVEAGRALLKQLDGADGLSSLERNRASIQNQVRRLEEQIPEARERADGSIRWHQRIFVVAAVLPKTGETKRLFQRFVLDKSDVDGFMKILMEETGDEDVGAVEQELDNRSLVWVIGTSLAFEFVILGAATWIFIRRDF